MREIALTNEDKKILQNMQQALPLMGNRQKAFFLGYLACLKEMKSEQLKQSKQQA